MDENRKNDLNAAYHTLCEYMLWRKDRTSKLSSSPEEISSALEIAAGAILDLIGHDICLEIVQNTLNIANKEIERLEGKDNELRRLRAILASHGIKYGKELKR